jgi:hypothetical protein
MTLLWAGGAFYLGYAWSVAWRAAMPGTTVLAVSYLMVIALLGLLIRAVAKGRNWARVTYAIFAVLGIVSIALTWLQAEALPLITTLLLVAVPLAYITILALLFHPLSAPWFDRARGDAT